MKAIIMAGGEGTRLRPLTCTIPKPMVPILGKPVMEYIIDLLKTISIDSIDVTTYYLPLVISNYFGDGERYGIKLNYFTEIEPLGTGGSVLNTKLKSNETIIVISGDCVTDIDLKAAIEFHKAKASKATLILKRERFPLDYGIVILDKENRITRFLEKPSWGEVFSDTVNTGIYILEPEIFNYYNIGDCFDFSKDLFPHLLSDNIPMYGYVTQNYWNDIGDMNSYRQTQFDVLDNKIHLPIKYRETAEGVYVGENTEISSSAKINSPAIIGDNCIVKNNVLIDSYSIIGNNTVIEQSSTIKRSIIWNNVSLGKNVQCRGTTICDGVIVSDSVNIYENSVIGSDTQINSNALINPAIKIWPSKTIDKNSTITSNLVWGTKSSRLMFSNSSLKGELNHEITPEYASMLSSIFSTILKSSKPIIVSYDDSPQSGYIKNSIIAGILSTGKHIISLSSLISPISRFAVRYFDCCGGIHIRKDIDNSALIHIELFNSNGGNIDRKLQKNIEQLYQRGDFERCNGIKINGITEINKFAQLYMNIAASRLTNIHSLHQKRLNIMLAAPTNLIGTLGKIYLNNMGCNVKLYLQEESDYTNGSSFLKHISRIMKNLPFDYGFLINDNGETLLMFDENNKLLSEEKYKLLTYLITLKTNPRKELIIPIDTTETINKLATEYNTKIIRTHSNTSDMMNAMLSNLSTRDEEPLQYVLNFNSLAAIGNILNFLIESGQKLSELFNEIPAFYIKKSELNCAFEKRGSIIRRLIEENQNNSIEMFEGIKINSKNGWALILPDNDRPVFRILSEGHNEEFATEIISGINSELHKLIDLP